MARAVRLHSFGGPDVLRVENVSVPQPGGSEVRLRVHAIGLNRTEVIFRSGRSAAKPVFPSPIGFEAAGVIDAMGTGVSGFRIGDRVALIPAYGPSEYGLYAEFSLAPARSLVKIPDTMTFVDAAALWVAYATAWGGLIEAANLAKGQNVVLPAASSSVGLAAIQVARQLGATPFALSRSSQKNEILLAAGAEAVIASEGTDISDEVLKLTANKGADVVFDPVGGPQFAQLVTSAASGARLVLYGIFSPELTVFPTMSVLSKGLLILGFALPAMTRDDAKLEAVKQYVLKGVTAGVFRPSIAKTFPFEQIADAHRFIELGRHAGKVVVTV
jgi:NADPH:quinone reductase-like Zn-dependent oxidoreductase